MGFVSVMADKVQNIKVCNPLKLHRFDRKPPRIMSVLTQFALAVFIITNPNNKIMRRKLLLIGIAMSIGLNFIFAQNDTLNEIFEFNSPATNPWGLTFDGTNLWISDCENGCLYKSSLTGETLDSIHVRGTKIKGIEFVDDTLWGINSQIVDDTTIIYTWENYSDTVTYPIFALYKIDLKSGLKLDSIRLRGAASNISSDYFWGLTYLRDSFYISYNGGWGPCLVQVNKSTSEYNELCCTHLAGMCTVSDTIWAIRNGGNILTTTNGTNENWKYRIDCKATDITFDGTNFWVVDTLDKKIKKLKANSATSINELRVEDKIKIYPNPTREYLMISGDSNLDINSIMIFDVKGQLIEHIPSNRLEFQIINISHFAKGEYFICISFDNNIVSKLFVKN